MQHTIQLPVALPQEMNTSSYQSVLMKVLLKLGGEDLFPNFPDVPYAEYLKPGEMLIRFDKETITFSTDHGNCPEYGAIWKISQERKTLTYSHTECDL